MTDYAWNGRGCSKVCLIDRTKDIQNPVLAIKKRPQQLSIVRKMLNQPRDTGRMKKDAQIMFPTNTKQKDKSQNYKENSKSLNHHSSNGNLKKQQNLG